MHPTFSHSYRIHPASNVQWPAVEDLQCPDDRKNTHTCGQYAGGNQHKCMPEQTSHTYVPPALADSLFVSLASLSRSYHAAPRLASCVFFTLDRK